MCVCLYVSMYVGMCRCVYVYVRVCMHVWMHVCMFVCIYVCMFICMYVRIYVCMHACMYICMHICTYVCMYAYMYACSHVCMYLQTKTGGKRMMRHDRSRGGSISVASSTVTPWSTGSFPWSPTPVSPSLLFFSYTYIYRSAPALSDTCVSAVDWIVNVVRRTLATNHPSPFFPVPLCDLPFRMLFPLLPAYFKPRAIPLLPSLDFDSMY
jgi:hypothetical protein